jgi:pimeloyl-ACP methyl ester carboxylesterase
MRRAIISVSASLGLMLRLLAFAAVLASFSLLAACQSASPAAMALCPASRAAPVTDGMIDVGGGLSLHVHCMGSGEPTVLLEAGQGGSGTVWQLVQPELARLTRVCGYDRAGAGNSDSPTKPRPVAQITRELHALLASAHLAGPYVLAGHSIGGLYMRLYAAQYPGDVAGMVLVDASTEDQDTRMWSLEPAEELAAAWNNPRDREGISLDGVRAAMAQLRGANRSLGDKPLVVLTAGKHEGDGDKDLAAREEKVWQEMQAELPRLSSNSTQIIAPKSGHFLQFESPQLVIAAVREVVTAARTHGRVNGAPLRALAAE